MTIFSSFSASFPPHYHTILAINCVYESNWFTHLQPTWQIDGQNDNSALTVYLPACRTSFRKSRWYSFNPKMRTPIRTVRAEYRKEQWCWKTPWNKTAPDLSNPSLYLRLVIILLYFGYRYYYLHVPCEKLQHWNKPVPKCITIEVFIPHRDSKLPDERFHTKHYVTIPACLSVEQWLFKLLTSLNIG